MVNRIHLLPLPSARIYCVNSVGTDSIGENKYCLGTSYLQKAIILLLGAFNKYYTCIDLPIIIVADNESS